MNFNEDDFKKCLGSFASGVTVVTMMDASFEPQGCTISSFSSLSLEPAMISFNLGKDSRMHGKMINSDAFAVNILSEGQAGISRKFASNIVERWDDLNFTPGTYACPLLEGVSAYIECLTANIYDGGDHSIITGRVIDLKVFDNLKPLVYYMGNYFTLGEKI